MKFRDLPESASGGSLPFIKMADRDKLLGVFKGEAYEFYQIWEGKKIVPEGTKGAAFRFRINFVTKEGGAYVSKVMEQGKTVYNQLKHLNESYPLESTVVEVTRHGSTKDDTYYSILPLHPSKQPADASWKVINQVQLNTLEHAKAVSSPEPNFDEPPSETFEDSDEIPF